MRRKFNALVLQVLDERTLLLRIYLDLGHTETMPVRLRWLQAPPGGKEALTNFISSKVLDQLVDIEIHKLLSINSCFDKSFGELNALLNSLGTGITKLQHCSACETEANTCISINIAEASVYFWNDWQCYLGLETAAVEEGFGEIVVRGLNETNRNGDTGFRRRANDQS